MGQVFPHRGEIWLADFPGDSKLRPALVISTDTRNEYSTSIIAIPITTNLQPAPTHVLLPAGEGGLAYDSMARCENLTYVFKARARRGPFSGTISEALMREIERCAMLAIGII